MSGYLDCQECHARPSGKVRVDEQGNCIGCGDWWYVKPTSSARPVFSVRQLSSARPWRPGDVPKYGAQR